MVGKVGGGRWEKIGVQIPGSRVFHMAWANLTFCRAVAAVKGGLREAMIEEMSGWWLWDWYWFGKDVEGLTSIGMV